MKVCSVAECDRVHKARGWCKRHYLRWREYGDPLGGVRTRSKPRAEVGDTRMTDGGYVRVYVGAGRGDRGWLLQHRAVMEGLLGRALFPDETVHHVNGDRTDNRPVNLELWVKPQPCGVRVEDAVAWAREIVARYDDKEARDACVVRH